MKYDQLRAMAHNIADSLASGLCLMIGFRDVDVFAEARKSPDRALRVDFLSGTVSGVTPSRALREAVSAFWNALPEICAKHRVPVTSVRELSAVFHAADVNPMVTVTVEDDKGRRSCDDYAGTPLKKIRVLDSLGRVRRQKRCP